VCCLSEHRAHKVLQSFPNERKESSHTVVNYYVSSVPLIILSDVKYVFLSHLPFNAQYIFFAHLNSYGVTFEMQAETRLHSKTVSGIVATAHLSYRSEGINFIKISSSSLRSLHAGNRRDKKSRRI